MGSKDQMVHTNGRLDNIQSNRTLREKALRIVGLSKAAIKVNGTLLNSGGCESCLHGIDAGRICQPDTETCRYSYSPGALG